MTETSESRQQRLQTRLAPQIQELKENCLTLQMATVDEKGQPNVSYAPFVQSKGGFYIFISDIARHAHNLKHNGQAAIMLIEDENKSRQIFARKRLSFDVKAEIVPFNSPEWQQGVEALATRHGEVVNQLKSMQDFTLFNLIPSRGLFVKGFGQAFEVSPNEGIDLLHLDQGHIERN